MNLLRLAAVTAGLLVGMVTRPAAPPDAADAALRQRLGALEAEADRLERQAAESGKSPDEPASSHEPTTPDAP